MNFIIDGFCLFSNSQLCLLFRYLVWSCEDPATFRSLSQVNRFCGELAREHRGMKKVEFSREFKIPENWPFQKLKGRVLPNGQFHGFGEWSLVVRHPICIVDGMYSVSKLFNSEMYSVSNICVSGRLFVWQQIDSVFWFNMNNSYLIFTHRCKNCDSFHTFHIRIGIGPLVESRSRPCWTKQNLQITSELGTNRFAFRGITKSRVKAILELARKGRERPFQTPEGHNM